MKRILIASAIVTMTAFGSSAAFSDDNYCNVPMSDWQPRENLQQSVEAKGWEIKRISTDDGCYEVYAIDESGNRVKAYFDPKTFTMLRTKIDD